MSKFILLFLTFPALAATNSCEVSAEVRDSFRRSADTRSVLTKFPNDVWANRTYQDVFRQGLIYQPAIVEEYKAALAKHPDDPEYLYLYARVLIGTKTPAAIEALNQAIAKDPGYAPARLSLVEIYRAPNFKDVEKAKANLKAWMSACPNQFDGFRFLERMDDAEFVRTSATKLRTMLAAHTDDSAVGNYRNLWTLEFQSNPAPEFPHIREEIRADLAKLRELDASGSATSTSILRSTLLEGYKLTGDVEGTKWVEAKYPTAPSRSSGMSEVMQASQDWQAAHPYPRTPPGGTFDKAAYDARNKAFLDVTAEWVAKWPNDYNAWAQRISALQQNRETPDADVDRAAEGLKKSAPNTSNYSPEFRIASIYMQHNAS